VVVSGGLLVAPLAVEGQPAKKIYRIGFLDFISPDVPHAYSKDFLSGLHDLAYVEGRDFVMEYRFAAGHKERLPELAADLVRANVDVIVTLRHTTNDGLETGDPDHPNRFYGCR